MSEEKSESAISETKIETKQVFLRANNSDPIEIDDICELYRETELPDAVSVVQRQETYFGPKFTVESEQSKKQWKLTAPGPDREAIIWERDGMEWVQAAEVAVSIGEDLPQQKVCLQCGETITTSTHRTESFLGTCDR